MYALADHAFAVQREEVGAAWPQIAAIVSRVTDAPWSLDELRCALDEGKAQAWGIRHGPEIQCVLVTRIEHTGVHCYGLMWIAAGQGIEEGLDLYQRYIEPWFADQGCEWIDVHGRRGWRKILKEYEESSVVLRKRLIRKDH